MKGKVVSGIMLTLLLTNVLSLGFMIHSATATIEGYEWIDPAYSGYDPFFATVVVAYRSGYAAKINVTVYNNAFPAGTVNVSAVNLGFDWGINYSSTEVNSQNPYALMYNERQTFEVNFTVPSTSIASITALHEFTIWVEYVNSQLDSGTWMMSGSNFAVYAHATERSVGVKVGDWARYAVKTNWTGAIDPDFRIWSEIEWAVIEVTDVSGTVITFTGYLHLKNGTDQVGTGIEWDIAPTGSYGLVLWFIGSNLGPGDPILPSSVLTVNETVARVYNGVPRDNNHLSVLLPYELVPSNYNSCNMSCYWDKETGITTEQLLNLKRNDPPRDLSILYEMVDTNMWGTRRLDMNLDGRVDIWDIAWVAKCFGSYRDHQRWNPTADINQDGKIDIRDIVLIAKHFGETYP